ncbi:MAG: tRNA (adenosine(37)-N6)-threonylcarbamoyltransferase complex ATPase subunit type 1 TsaE, partial [Acetobacteraceae bacterium]
MTGRPHQALPQARAPRNPGRLAARRGGRASCRPAMESRTLPLPDLAATEALAARVAAHARAGDAILLSGPLGAGKSAFARAFLRAAAGDPGLDVPSPT